MIYLDNLRILATFAVIFLHVAAVIVISSPIGSQNWWIANIYDSMVRWLTFGIYLIHPMILDSLNLIGISSVSFNPIISVPILSIAVFSISIFMAYLISKCPYIRRII